MYSYLPGASKARYFGAEGRCKSPGDCLLPAVKAHTCAADTPRTVESSPHFALSLFIFSSFRCAQLSESSVVPAERSLVPVAGPKGWVVVHCEFVQIMQNALVIP